MVGWPALYTLLAQELADGLPTSSSIVLEHIHHLVTAKSSLGLLGSNLLARLPNTFSQILTTYKDLPASSIALPVKQYSSKDLKIDYQASLALADTYHVDLPKECLLKAIQLVDGRGVAMAGALGVCQELGTGFFHDLIRRSKNTDQFLTLLVRASLAGASGDEVRALTLALKLGYCHPELSRAAMGRPAIPLRPWMQSLSDGWLRLRYMWQAPLNTAFKAEHLLSEEINLVSLADCLVHQGATEKAVELCFAHKHYSTAARLIANAAEEMMNLGQWATLEGWLKQVPCDLLQEWPWLLYTQGEIATARGHLTEARRIFAISTNLFSARGEADGACQSLMAESTLAAWEGDSSRARGMLRTLMIWPGKPILLTR